MQGEVVFTNNMSFWSRPGFALADLSDIFDTDNFSSDVLFQMIMSAKDFDVVQCVKDFIIEANARRFPT